MTVETNNTLSDTSKLRRGLLQPADHFEQRHIGPRPGETAEMLQVLGVSTLDEMVEKAVPASIRSARPLDTGAEASEYEALADIRRIASKNRVFRSYIGMGYSAGPCSGFPRVRQPTRCIVPGPSAF